MKKLILTVTLCVAMLASANQNVKASTALGCHINDDGIEVCCYLDDEGNTVCEEPEAVPYGRCDPEKDLGCVTL